MPANRKNRKTPVNTENSAVNNEIKTAEIVAESIPVEVPLAVDPTPVETTPAVPVEITPVVDPTPAIELKPDIDSTVAETILAVELKSMEITPVVDSILVPPATSANFNTLRIPALKDELRKRHLKISGSRAELLQRLQDYDNSTEKDPAYELSLLLLKVSTLSPSEMAEKISRYSPILHGFSLKPNKDIPDLVYLESMLTELVARAKKIQEEKVPIGTLRLWVYGTDINNAGEDRKTLEKKLLDNLRNPTRAEILSEDDILVYKLKKLQRSELQHECFKRKLANTGTSDELRRLLREYLKIPLREHDWAFHLQPQGNFKMPDDTLGSLEIYCLFYSKSAYDNKAGCYLVLIDTPENPAKKFMTIERPQIRNSEEFMVYYKEMYKEYILSEPGRVRCSESICENAECTTCIVPELSPVNFTPLQDLITAYKSKTNYSILLTTETKPTNVTKLENILSIPTA